MAKMHNDWAENDLVATWIGIGKHSPSILYIVGTIKSNPYELVKVEVESPKANARYIKENIPFFDYIVVILLIFLKIFCVFFQPIDNIILSLKLMM